MNLYQYRARAYDPETGRFNQEDPIWFEANDLNVYRYVFNNPSNYTDPTGLATARENAALSGIILVAATGATLSAKAILDSDGATLAAELATKKSSTLARIGGNIACNFSIINSGFTVGGVPNSLCSTSNSDDEDDTAAPPSPAPDTGTPPPPPPNCDPTGGLKKLSEKPPKS